MKTAGLLLLTLSIFSCYYKPIHHPSPVAPAFLLQRVPISDWPALEDDGSLDDLKQAISRSLFYLKALPAGTTVFFGAEERPAAEIKGTLDRFKDLLVREMDPDRFRQELQRHFDLYRLDLPERAEPLLVTGYYEPTLEGRRSRSDDFPFPIYERPEDLLTVNLENFSKKFKGERVLGRLFGREVVPYFTRREIDGEGRLADRGLEILWTNDRLKLFFMQIQGSGQAVLEDGTLVKLRYQGVNGHPYFPIGRELTRRGILKPEEVSLQAIYEYLKANPQEQEGILNLNPSYVFFQETQGGPYGNLNVPLTSGRSVAMDQKFFPAGGLAWLSTVKPALDSRGKINYWAAMKRWVTIQDTGGAIKGPGRLDFFWGSGAEAEMAAGHLRHGGTIYLLLKKD
ncbi:MAG: MltA domain-containing protein [Deltaproteobacteria bacterium]|nr:MltA domain-containing protein [Deltaproteobacteria bacterium]